VVGRRWAVGEAARRGFALGAALLCLVPAAEPSDPQKAPPASVSRKVPPPPRVTSLDVTVNDANSLADGAFRIGGLEARPYTLATGSDLAGWAIRSGLSPGDEPVILTLQPGGHIAVRVLGADDRPVKDAYPHVRSVGGQRVSMPGMVSGPTDPNGAFELNAPAGVVDVEARKDAQRGGGTVTVRAGETVPLVLHLE